MILRRAAAQALFYFWRVVTKFLVVRFSSIGDIVLTTPVIRCLKQQFNGTAEIHFLTKKKFGFLLENNPNISKLFTIEEKVGEVSESLKAEEYQFVIDLHNNLRSMQVKSRLKTAHLTFNKLNFEKWLMVNLKINRLPNQHIVSRYLAPLRFFDIEYDGKGLDYFFPNNFSTDFFSEFFKVLGENYVVFAIGGTYFTKRLPKEKILVLCKQMSGKVLLIGGKEDEAIGNWLQKQLPEVIISACGKFTVHQSAYAIKNSNAVIAHDTGMMHIAAAFNKPLASIWGNTIPAFGMYPLLPDHYQNRHKIFEIIDLKCRPCSKLGFNQCPKKHFKCMQQINEAEIAGWVSAQ